MEKLLRTFAGSSSIARLGAFVFVFLMAVGPSSNAEELKKARVSQVIQDVRLLGSNAAPRPAAVNDNVDEGTAVRTGTNSRTELTFTDLTITRLGENTIFSYRAGTRELDLSSGAVLVEVPPRGAAVKINTAAVTAAISGGTALFSKGPPSKFLVLEGTGTFYPAGHPEEAVTLHGGDMVMMTKDGKITRPTKFNVQLVLETSPLINDFPDLANLPLILAVIEEQAALSEGPPSPASKDIIDVISLSTVSPTLLPTLLPTPIPIPATTVIYTSAPAGTWSNTANWNPMVVPNNGNGGLNYNAVISGGTLTQDISLGVTIQQLQMSGGTLILSNPLTLNAGLQFSGGTIGGGNLFIAGPSTQSALMTVNGLTITNSGSYSIAFDNSNVFSGSATFNNSGTLSKTTGTGTDNFNIPLNNSGTVSSENGTLLFSIGGTSAGTFSASAGATVEFASNWTFTNGTHFSGAGTIQLDNNTITFLSGTIINSGTISLNAAGGFSSDLRISDGTMLTGSGSVILSDNLNNHIWGLFNSGTETLTNVNNTISGAGQIGFGNSIEFINQSAGVIDATGTNALIISPTLNATLVSANGGGFVNQGLLEATAAGGLVLNGGQFNNTGGVILANGVTSQVQLINSVSVTGGTLRTTNGGNFSINGNAAVDQITGTSGTITVMAAGALSAVNGINFNGVNGGPGGTLSLSAPSVTFGTAASEINGALFNGGDATGPSSPGGDGGAFTVTATSGDITVGSDIEASTGANGSSVSTGGTGGTVNLTANNGQVTVNNRIQVSHNSGSRKSASGGNINITSGKTTGVAINVSSSAQLLALLNAAAPGPGGKITILATSPTGNSSSINVNGTVQADRGTVDIEHAGDNGQINLTNADVRADIVKIGAFGTNGALNIGGGTLSADTTLKLYAPGSSGTVNFIANVTLTGASAKIIAGDTVNIFDTVIVTIGGASPASVFTNHANYTGFGGNGSRTGTFAGAGATTSSLSGAPGF